MLEMSSPSSDAAPVESRSTLGGGAVQQPLKHRIAARHLQAWPLGAHFLMQAIRLFPCHPMALGSEVGHIPKSLLLLDLSFIIIKYLNI